MSDEKDRLAHRIALEGNPVFTELRLDRDVWKERAERAEEKLSAWERVVIEELPVWVATALKVRADRDVK